CSNANACCLWSSFYFCIEWLLISARA
ncbi:unnamed protein product, partial [Rotaria sp. Silwood1]